MSELVCAAFRALGPAATAREVAMVAAALRESGDQEVGPLLNYVDNPEDWERCCELAEEEGAGGFVALDLALAFHNPRAFAGLVRGEDEHLPTRLVD